MVDFRGGFWQRLLAADFWGGFLWFYLIWEVILVVLLDLRGDLGDFPGFGRTTMSRNQLSRLKDVRP